MMATQRPTKKPGNQRDRTWAIAKPIIDQIVAEQAAPNRFAFYGRDDIAQEIRIICLEALREYDPTRGNLTRFLRATVSNRLKNLRRPWCRARADRQLTPGMRMRMKLMEPWSTSTVPDDEFLSREGKPLTTHPGTGVVDAADFRNAMLEHMPSGLMVLASGYIFGKPIDPSGLEAVTAFVRNFLGDL